MLRQASTDTTTSHTTSCAEQRERTPEAWIISLTEQCVLDLPPFRSPSGAHGRGAQATTAVRRSFQRCDKGRGEDRASMLLPLITSLGMCAPPLLHHPRRMELRCCSKGVWIPWWARATPVQGLAIWSKDGRHSKEWSLALRTSLLFSEPGWEALKVTHDAASVCCSARSETEDGHYQRSPKYSRLCRIIWLPELPSHFPGLCMEK